MPVLVGSHVLAQQPDPAAQRLADLKKIHKDVELLMTLPAGPDRRWAVVRLGCAGPNAVPAVCLLLDDPRLEVRALVYRVLEEIGPRAKGSVPSLTRKLTAEDRWERVRAAQLALTFDRACEPAMLVLGRSRNREYRRRAANTLWRAAAPKAVHVLADLVDDEYESVRAPAITSLSSFGEHAAPIVPKLIDAMNSKGAGKLQIEDIPGAMATGGDRLSGANRALFELGTVAVKPLLARHAKARPKLQFRILHVLGAMGATDAQRQAIRVSLLAEDARLRKTAFACLMNLELELPGELPILLTSSARFETPVSRERIRRYLKATTSRPFAVLRTTFPKVPPKQREIILSVLPTLTAIDRLDRFQHTELLVLAARDKAPGVRAAAVRAIVDRLQDDDPGTLKTLLSTLEGFVRAGMDVPLSKLEKRLRSLASTGPESVRSSARSLLKAASRR